MVKWEREKHAHENKWATEKIAGYLFFIPIFSALWNLCRKHGCDEKKIHKLLYFQYWHEHYESWENMYFFNTIKSWRWRKIYYLFIEFFPLSSIDENEKVDGKLIWWDLRRKTKSNI